MSNILLTNGKLCDKLTAHQLGLQHYAFSILLFNENNEILLQKRAKCKYHSGSLWSNTCCSHFRNNKEFANKEDTAKARLKEELGMDFNNALTQILTFSYNKPVIANNNNDNDDKYLIENEIDDVFVGKITPSTTLLLNQNEVENVKFVNFDRLAIEIKTNNSIYTPWLIEIMSNSDIITKIKAFLQKNC